MSLPVPHLEGKHPCASTLPVPGGWLEFEYFAVTVGPLHTSPYFGGMVLKILGSDAAGECGCGGVAFVRFQNFELGFEVKTCSVMENNQWENGVVNQG